MPPQGPLTCLPWPTSQLAYSLPIQLDMQTRSSGTQPVNHASVESFVVPVLPNTFVPAAWTEVAVPYSTTLVSALTTSLATPLLTTRSIRAEGGRNSSCPCPVPVTPVRTSVKPVGEMCRPPLAKVA